MPDEVTFAVVGLGMGAARALPTVRRLDGYLVYFDDRARAMVFVEMLPSAVATIATSFAPSA